MTPEEQEKLQCPILDDNGNISDTLLAKLRKTRLDMRITLGNLLTLAVLLVTIATAWQRLNDKIDAHAPAVETAHERERLASIDRQLGDVRADLRIVLQAVLDIQKNQGGIRRGD